MRDVAQVTILYEFKRREDVDRRRQGTGEAGDRPKYNGGMVGVRLPYERQQSKLNHAEYRRGEAEIECERHDKLFQEHPLCVWVALWVGEECHREVSAEQHIEDHKRPQQLVPPARSQGRHTPLLHVRMLIRLAAWVEYFRAECPLQRAFAVSFFV